MSRGSSAMERGIAALAAAVFVQLGATTASAGVEGAMSLDLLPPTVGPGGLVIAEYVGCLGGQVVEFTLAGAEQGISCVGADGGVSPGASRAVFEAPRAAGSYFVNAQIVGVSGSNEEATLTVVAAGPLIPDDLADTGSASGPAVTIAATAVVVGLSLLGAARIRRRPSGP